MSIEVDRKSCMGFRMLKIILTPPPVTSKGQDQTLKTLKSNISKTVRDREKVSIEVG